MYAARWSQRWPVGLSSLWWLIESLMVALEPEEGRRGTRKQALSPAVLLRGSEDCTRWWIWHCQGAGKRRAFTWKWSATHQTSLKLTGRQCRLSFFNSCPPDTSMCKWTLEDHFELLTIQSDLIRIYCIHTSSIYILEMYNIDVFTASKTNWQTLFSSLRSVQDIQRYQNQDLRNSFC